MNFKNLFILLISFYFLVLLQYGFFSQFTLRGIVPNIVLISVCLLNFFEKKERKEGILGSVFAGLFLDIFSGFLFGTSIAALLIVGIIFKRSHFMLKESQENFPLSYFLPLFVFCFILYYFLIKVGIMFSYNFSFHFDFDSFLGALSYNSVIAVILFYLFKLIFKKS